MTLDHNRQFKMRSRRRCLSVKKKVGIGPLTTYSGAWKPDYCQCFKQGHDLKLKIIKTTIYSRTHTLTHTSTQEQETLTTSVDIHLNTAATVSQTKSCRKQPSNYRLFSVTWSRPAGIKFPALIVMRPNTNTNSKRKKKSIANTCVHIYTNRGGP